MTRLQHNPEPLKVVPVRRGEATGREGMRCDHEDGRGRCTSRETTSTWEAATRTVWSFCVKHTINGGSQ